MNRGIPGGEFDKIHIAARTGDIEELKRLIRSGANVDRRNRVAPNGDGGNTPLWFACQGPRSQPAVVQELLNAGADVNAICEHGTTAAHLACSWGHEKQLKLLYESGADFDIADIDGMTPEIVARNGYSWQQEKVTRKQRGKVIAFFDSLA